MNKLLVAFTVWVLLVSFERRALGDEHKITWKGKVAVGLLNEAQNMVDRRKTDVNAVCGILGNDSDGNEYCGPAKSKDNTQIGNGFWEVTELGADFKQSDAVSAHVLFEHNLSGKAIEAKKFYVNVDIGAGF